MSSIGTITLNLQTVDRDETVYKTAAHNVSHTDLVALRRTLPRSGTATPLRTQIRFERGFPLSGAGAVGELPATISIAVTAPPGVVAADVEAWVTSSLTQSAAKAGSVAITGDIHLD